LIPSNVPSLAETILPPQIGSRVSANVEYDLSQLETLKQLFPNLQWRLEYSYIHGKGPYIFLHIQGSRGNESACDFFSNTLELDLVTFSFGNEYIVFASLMSNNDISFLSKLKARRADGSTVTVGGSGYRRLALPLRSLQVSISNGDVSITGYTEELNGVLTGFADVNTYVFKAKTVVLSIYFDKYSFANNYANCSFNNWLDIGLFMFPVV